MIKNVGVEHGVGFLVMPTSYGSVQGACVFSPEGDLLASAWPIYWPVSSLCIGQCVACVLASGWPVHYPVGSLCFSQCLD